MVNLDKIEDHLGSPGRGLRKIANEVGGNHQSLDHSLQSTEFQVVSEGIL